MNVMKSCRQRNRCMNTTDRRGIMSGKRARTNYTNFVKLCAILLERHEKEAAFSLNDVILGYKGNRAAPNKKKPVDAGLCINDQAFPGVRNIQHPCTYTLYLESNHRAGTLPEKSGGWLIVE